VAATLSRVRIAGQAAALARRRGVEAITVRSVASALRVTPMALYRHIGSAAGLRQAALEVMLLDVPVPPARGAARARLRRWAHAARAALARYPGLADALLTDWPSLVQGCRIVESLLAVAAVETDDVDRQVAIANALFVYVVTRVHAERAVTRGLHDGRTRALPAVRRAPERFPRLAEAAPCFAVVDTDAHFERGLRALLDGLLDATAEPVG